LKIIFSFSAHILYLGLIAFCLCGIITLAACCGCGCHYMNKRVNCCNAPAFVGRWVQSDAEHQALREAMRRVEHVQIKLLPNRVPYSKVIICSCTVLITIVYSISCTFIVYRCILNLRKIRYVDPDPVHSLIQGMIRIHSRAMGYSF